MLACLRRRRLVASLVTLSLWVGVLAPALVCSLAMARPEPEPAAPTAMRVGDQPCPAHSEAPDAPEPAPADTDCCVVTAPMAPAPGGAFAAPAAALVALLAGYVEPTHASNAISVPRAVPRPPAPPGPLHLLNGVFLT